jgi:hypothetical protein
VASDPVVSRLVSQLAADLKPRRLHYSVGMTITEDIQAAILKVPAESWIPA